MADYTLHYLNLRARDIGNPIAPKETEITEKKEWFDALMTSIEKNGVINPIITEAKLGRDPIIQCRYGGCRLYISQILDISLPTIVCDFDNIFRGFEPIPFNKLRNYFKYPPKKIINKGDRLNVSGLPDIHMENIS